MKVEYIPGQLINENVFIKEIDPHIFPSGRKARKAVFVCRFCGKAFNGRIDAIISYTTSSCGCHLAYQRKKNATTHGLLRSKERGIWGSIKSRCYNTNDKGYRNYGGRGIKICNEWKNDFQAFYDYVTNLDSYDKHLTGQRVGELSLDRIDNDGDYEIGNLRWAQRNVQASNKRFANNKHGYIGVNKIGRKFYNRITLNGKRKLLGPYETVKGSVDGRNEFIIKNNLTDIYTQQEFKDN